MAVISPLTRRRRQRSMKRRRPLRRYSLRHRRPTLTAHRRRRPRRTSVIIRPPRDKGVIHNVYHPIRNDWVLDVPKAVYRADPKLLRITRAAQNALQRRGLLHGVWPARLAQADDILIRFINRFYKVAGFEYAVRDYFGSRTRQRYALHAIRFAIHQARRLPNFHRVISFERILRQTASGRPVLSLAVNIRGHRYRPADVF